MSWVNINTNEIIYCIIFASNESCYEYSVIGSVQKVEILLLFFITQVLFSTMFCWIFFPCQMMAFQIYPTTLWSFKRVQFCLNWNFILVANESISSTNSRHWLWICREEWRKDILACFSTASLRWYWTETWMICILRYYDLDDSLGVPQRPMFWGLGYWSRISD